MTQYSKQHPQSSLAYQLVKARVRVDMNHDPLQLLANLKNEIKSTKANKDIGQQYGIVLTQIQLNNDKTAYKALEPLLKKYPHERLFQMALARIQNGLNQKELALQTLEYVHDRNPHYYPANKLYGRTLLNDHQVIKAEKFLQEQVRKTPKKIGLYSLLAEAQAKNNHLCESHITQAELLKRLGYKKEALVQLEIALRTPSKNPYAKIQVTARIDALKKTI